MTDVSNSKMTDVSVDFDKWPRSVPVPKLYKVAANVYRVRKLFFKASAIQRYILPN